MTRILVVGGAGYIGSHCCKALKLAGHEPVVFDNLSSGHAEFVRWGPLVTGDVRDGAALAAAFRDHRPEAVMHFAALAAVGESVRDPGRYYDVNVGGTLRLLEAMREAGVGSIVFSSTCAVYGTPDRMPIDETTTERPINPYGDTKLVCERMMDAFDRAHGIRSVRLRYFNAAGADQNGEIGEWHEDETHLIPLVVEATLGRMPPVSILGTDYATPDGTAIRDYIHVEDLASAHAAAIAYLADGGASTSINLGTGTGASVREVIETVARVSGRKVPHGEAPRRPGDPDRLVADAAKALSVLGWSPARSRLETIVADAWRWHSSRNVPPRQGYRPA